jgi:chromosome segregation ATPase
LDKIVNGYTPEDGEKVEGLVEKVAANKAAIEGLKTQIGTDIATELGKLDVTAGDEDKAVTKYVSYVEQTDGKISAHYETLDAANVAAKYPHGETAAEMTVQQALDKLSAQDETLGGQIEGVDARIDALLGSDKANDGTTQLTIRQIANAELAKQLIPENAAEARDTLEEIAAWIQEHPEDAAAMNADIANLKTALAGYIVTKDGTVTVTDVKGVIDALALRLDNKDTELNNAITALTGTVTANKNEIDAYTVNGKKISENPSLVSGDIKMSTVVGSTADTQTVQDAIAQVQANVTTAEGKITDLTAELNKVNVTGGDGVKVVKSDRTFTVSIEKIDAGSYDDDDTTEA